MLKRLLAFTLGILVVLGAMTIAHAERQFVVTGDYLRIRLANATSDETGEYWRKGTVITAESEDDFWVYFTYKGQKCKSYKDYLQPCNETGSNSNTSNNTATATQKSTQKGYYSFGIVLLEKGSTVNVRKGPSSKQNIIGTFAEHEYIIVTGETNKYYKVQYKNREAYVQKAYVELCSNIPLPISGDPVAVGGQKYLNATGKPMTLTLNDYGEIVIFVSN